MGREGNWAFGKINQYHAWWNGSFYYQPSIGLVLTVQGRHLEPFQQENASPVQEFQLTHFLLDKMAAISQMTFSNAFLWMKSSVFWIQFHQPGTSSLNTNTYFNFEFSIQWVNKGSCSNKSLKRISNPNSTRPCSSIQPSSVVRSFWNFAHSMAVSQPCSVQNFKMIGQLWKTLWANVYVDSGMDFRYHIETSPRPSLWCPYHSLWPGSPSLKT